MTGLLHRERRAVGAAMIVPGTMPPAISAISFFFCTPLHDLVGIQQSFVQPRQVYL